MAYTKQGPFADRALPALTGAKLNAWDQALDDLYNKSAFKVYRNAAFNVSDGTQLQFDTAEFDPDGLYKLAAGATQYKFVCPRAGLWHFEALLAIGGAPGALDTYFGIRFFKNGTGGTLYEGDRVPNRGYAIDVPGSTYAALDVGDTFEAYLTAGAAIAATAITPGAGRTWFAGQQIRAT